MQIFSGFEWIDLVEIAAIFSIGELRAYFANRSKNKALKCLGDEPSKIMLFDSGKTRYFDYTMYGIGSFLIIGNLFVSLKTGFNWEFTEGIVYGLGIIYFPSRFKNTQTIKIGENGIVYNDFVILWEELDRIEWDRDIKQKSWGIKFYKKGQIAPLKMYVNRKFRESFDNSIKESLNKRNYSDKYQAIV